MFISGQWLFLIACKANVNLLHTLNIVVFSLIFVIFLNSASSAAALVFYLPGVCTRTDTKGKTEKDKSPEYFKIFEKTFYKHPVQ